MFQLDRSLQCITFEGKTYPQENIQSIVEKHQENEIKDLINFLQEWFNDSPTIKVQSSGSTGTPKIMEVEKDRMMQSAILTCTYLNLRKGDKTLLCMSLKHIGAKMIVVRSLIAELDLYVVPTSGYPLKNTNLDFDFAAMVPLQVYNSLQDNIQAEQLKKIKKLIIGGGAIDESLLCKIENFPNSIYSTYGMTETLSHIALKKINGKDKADRYIPFNTVSLQLSKDNTLIIHAPLINKEKLQTNDVARIFEDGSFRILGRIDNIVNSGGLKIQIEEVEATLSKFIKGEFAISSLPDPKFGEILVLVTGNTTEVNESEIEKIQPHYHIPKRTIKLSSIPLTENGKINRPEIKKAIEKFKIEHK